jgi:hypothetical protein
VVGGGGGKEPSPEVKPRQKQNEMATHTVIRAGQTHTRTHTHTHTHTDTQTRRTVLNKQARMLVEIVRKDSYLAFKGCVCDVVVFAHNILGCGILVESAHC